MVANALKGLGLATVLLAPVLLTGCPGGQEPQVSFANEIKPILGKHCLECHVEGGPGQVKSGLNMETYEGLMKGTRYGPVIDPGNSLSSTLIILVEGRADPSLAMPHGARDKLNATEIGIIKRWIDQGAKNN